MLDSVNLKKPLLHRSGFSIFWELQRFGSSAETGAYKGFMQIVYKTDKIVYNSTDSFGYILKRGVQDNAGTEYTAICAGMAGGD